MNIMRRTTHLALSASLVLAMSASAAHGETGIGVNAVVRNSVQMKILTDTVFRPAVVREPVHIGDAVVSGPKSLLQVLLLDKTVFTVGANARMTIDRFVYDPDRDASDVALSVAKGSFRFLSGRSLHGQGQTAIGTPVGSIGVRGTMVEGAVGSDVRDVLDGESGLPSAGPDVSAATLVVLRGPGPKSQGLDKPGAIDFTVKDQVISVEDAGLAVLVWGPDQKPFGPFRLSDAASARLTGLLMATPSSPSAQRDRRNGAAAAAIGLGILFGAREIGGSTEHGSSQGPRGKPGQGMGP